MRGFGGYIEREGGDRKGEWGLLKGAADMQLGGGKGGLRGAREGGKWGHECERRRLT